MAKSISNPGRLFIAGAALVAAGGAAYYVGHIYPTHGAETVGTIAPASRYQAPQVQSADVNLGDNSVPLLMQTDAFDVMVKNPSFRALAASQSFMILAQNPAALNAVARNPAGVHQPRPQPATVRGPGATGIHEPAGELSQPAGDGDDGGVSLQRVRGVRS